MNPPPLTEWLNQLLAALQWLQNAVLTVLHWLTGKATEFGQPAWLFAQRIAGEVLMIDHGLARQVLYSLVSLAVLFILLLLFIFWRKRRWPVLVLAAALIVVTPWPSPQLIFTTAYPTSFHQSPTQFSSESIALGRVLYQQHCLACHGVDGKGGGDKSKTLRRYPPDLSSQLLGRRADGEVAWRILHGMQDHRGEETMPGFAGSIEPQDVWALLDYMKALGAGEGAKRDGVWPIPVALPNFTVHCEGRPANTLYALRNQQRVRLIAASAAEDAALLEDPRLFTVMVTPSGASRTNANMKCWAHDSDAWDNLALIAGTTPQALAGSQLLADRHGWLRARTFDAWSDEDFLCTAASSDSAAQEPEPGDAANTADGLGALIQRMDNEPVRYIKGGFVH